MFGFDFDTYQIFIFIREPSKKVESGQFLLFLNEHLKTAVFLCKVVFSKHT